MSRPRISCRSSSLIRSTSWSAKRTLPSRRAFSMRRSVERAVTVLPEADSPTSASFSLDVGEKLALVGESASGKTVTALSTLRLIENARLEGSIRFADHEVLRMSDEDLHEMRGRDIAVVFQEPMTALNPLYSVGQQIVESIE